ncbi:cell wall-binding repeat-containing protein [Methanocaldococcus sp. 16A]
MRIASIIVSILIIVGVLPLSFASSENVAIIVSKPADAIVAAPYAKAMGYMLIYTPPDKLSDEAKRELERNHITKVIIVGGPVAVSNNVENQLKLDLKLNTERIWGETRVETSQKVFETLIKEKPEMAKNLVIVEGFNEKISPVAVSFDAPVLYYAPGKEKEVAETLKSVKVENTVILGTKIPKEIQKVATSVSKNTIIAYGKNDEIIKTALSYVPKLNPEVKDKKAAIVYSEKSVNPIINSILQFVKGNIGAIIPLPEKNENVIKSIISKITTFTSTTIVSTDTPEISTIVSNIASNLGISSETIAETGVSGGGGGGYYYTTPTAPTTPPTQKYTVISINNGEKVIKIADIGDSKEDGNYVEVIGDTQIKLPEIKIITNAVDKEYSINGNNVSIKFEGNANALNLIYPIEFGAVTYGDNVKVNFYGSKALANKEITLHVITNRQELRDAMNDLLNGNATTLINLLNNSPVKITKTTDSNGDATFTVAPQNYGENIIVITEGNGNIGNDVTILGVGGFEYLKYRLSLDLINIMPEDLTNMTTLTFNMSLNQTPSNSVRYGLLVITKDGYKGTIEVVGTTPNDKYFNVSVVGDKGSETIVENSDLIALNASKVKNIADVIFGDTTAGAEYSEITTNSTIQISVPLADIPAGTECYAIGIVYDTKDKKIVALNQTEITIQ